MGKMHVSLVATYLSHERITSENIFPNDRVERKRVNKTGGPSKTWSDLRNVMVGHFFFLGEIYDQRPANDQLYSESLDENLWPSVKHFLAGNAVIGHLVLTGNNTEKLLIIFYHTAHRQVENN
jgi:hypothetical protein